MDAAAIMLPRRKQHSLRNLRRRIRLHSINIDRVSRNLGSRAINRCRRRQIKPTISERPRQRAKLTPRFLPNCEGTATLRRRERNKRLTLRLRFSPLNQPRRGTLNNRMLRQRRIPAISERPQPHGPVSLTSRVTLRRAHTRRDPLRVKRDLPPTPPLHQTRYIPLGCVRPSLNINMNIAGNQPEPVSEPFRLNTRHAHILGSFNNFCPDLGHSVLEFFLRRGCFAQRLDTLPANFDKFVDLFLVRAALLRRDVERFTVLLDRLARIVQRVQPSTLSLAAIQNGVCRVT